MSYKHYPYDILKGKKDQENRSRKTCICGGHSAKDVKKNIHHHAIAKRLEIRKARRFKMKKILIALLLVLFASTAWAAPFLVCDPQTNVDSYVVVLDGVTSTSTPQDLGDGTVRLHFDLAGLSDGSHHVEVSAKNVWGESASTPFDFTKALPGAPGGLGISGD